MSLSSNVPPAQQGLFFFYFSFALSAPQEVWIIKVTSCRMVEIKNSKTFAKLIGLNQDAQYWLINHK